MIIQNFVNTRNSFYIQGYNVINSFMVIYGRDKALFFKLALQPAAELNT